MMKNSLIACLAICALIFNACNRNQKKEKSPQNDVQVASPESQTKKDVPFILAHNYFVKNTVPESKNGVHKLENQNQFDELIGPAAGMGENAKPTEIDFSKQFVIAVIRPESDHLRTEPHIELTEKDATINVLFKEELGEKTSYTTRGLSLLIVDKQYDGNVVLINADDESVEELDNMK